MIYRLLSWIMLVGLVLGVYVWQQTQAVRMGYRVDAVRKECMHWENENQSLRLKVNTLLSLERLNAVAQQRQFVTPKEKDIVYLDGDE